ncbi:MAG: ATP-binding cassette domain-containing protein, partial [Kiloniellales bacterium]|nr:ATP-binding cassette domain-containing protein [Kiloniellales bacterium]
DSGAAHFCGREITHTPTHRRARLGLMRAFQIVSIFREFTVLENLIVGVLARERHAFQFWAPARKDENLKAFAREIARLLELESKIEVIAQELSHGDLRRLELAMALASKPRALLLDEPLAGLGPEESRSMTELLRNLRTEYGILLVEHDMDAVFQLADRITVLVNGEVIASGPPQEIRNDIKVQEAYLGEDLPCLH